MVQFMNRDGFKHVPAPATQMRMRGHRTPIRCCACRDCNYGPDSYSRTREKREWRKGIHLRV